VAVSTVNVHTAPEQLRVALVDSPVARQGVARMQVDRHAECLGALPHRPEALVVVVPAGGGVTDVGVAVEHYAGKPELGRASLQLGRGRSRVLHRQGGEPAIAGGVTGHDLRQRVVDLLGTDDSAAKVGLRLDAGRSQRQERVVDAGRVHLPQPHGVHIQQPPGDLPHHLGIDVLRNAELREIEVFLESDLA
jgi:hypothetical protein